MLIMYTMLSVVLFVLKEPDPLEKVVGFFFFLNLVKICEIISHILYPSILNKSHVHILVLITSVQQNLFLGNIQLPKHLRLCLHETSLYSEVVSHILCRIVYMLRNLLNKIKRKLVEIDLFLCTN